VSSPILGPSYLLVRGQGPFCWFDVRELFARLIERKKTMPFKEIKTSSNTYLDQIQKKGKRRTPHFFPNSSQEQETSSVLSNDQGKGKDVLSPELEKWLKSRPIGEDGKPVEKRVILSERYGKENPGLAGGVTGILETFGTAAASWAVKEGLSKLWEFGKNMIMGKKESAEEKLDRLFMSYYETGLNHLKNATMTQDDQRREGSIHRAADNFLTAANLIQTGCFVKAKSMLSVAGCHHLIGEYDVAQHWLEKAYEEGLAEYERSHTRYELAQFKSEIMVPLEKLLKSYPPTSNSTVPLLTQFGRLETGSSSSTSDKSSLGWVKNARNEIRRQDTTDRSLLRHPERLTEIDTLTGHNNWVASLVVHDGRLISGSSDGLIKVWDINTGRCINTITGHSNSATSLVVHDGRLISGSGDNTIKVWDINTGRCINTITGHNYFVSSLVVHDGRLISGSGDNTVKMWDINTGRCSNTIRGHNDWVRSLVAHGGRLISGSYDRTIKVWDINTGRCINTIRGHNDVVNSLVVHEGRLVSGSRDGTIKVWDINTGKYINTITSYNGGVCSLVVHEGRSISGSRDGTIEIWDINEDKCINTLKGHNSSVSSLVIHNGLLISGSHDKTIKAWGVK
jgi:WD40 repeat protein